MIDFSPCVQSENARELWMEMNVQDYITPGKYEWAEVWFSITSFISALAISWLKSS